MESARPARAGQEWMTEGFRVRMAPLADFSIDSGGLAQLARAPALQAGGQRFESVILHSEKDIDMMGSKLKRVTQR